VLPREPLRPDQRTRPHAERWQEVAGGSRPMAPSRGDSTTRRGSPSAPAEDTSGNMLRAVTYIAEGNTDDGCPSFRYITLLREGAREHGLPEHTTSAS
jgi:hypothetical protein